MPTFETPTPIDLAIDLQVGRIDVEASDRTDTVVTVIPSKPGKAADVHGAEGTRVEFSDGRVTVAGPRPFILFGPSESVDVRVQVPSGSRFTAEIAVGEIRTAGRLGATRIKSSTGDVDLEATGDLWMRPAHGQARVGTIDGTLDLVAGHGQVRIGRVTGAAIVKTQHGGITIGESGESLEANLAYGNLEIASAGGSVTGKSAYGRLELGEVSSGSIRLESAFGALVIGVRTGVAAWLDASAKDGVVRNSLDTATAPDTGEQSVEIRARTSHGDITIHRSTNG